MKCAGKPFSIVGLLLAGLLVAGLVSTTGCTSASTPSSTAQPTSTAPIGQTSPTGQPSTTGGPSSSPGQTPQTTPISLPSPSATTAPPAKANIIVDHTNWDEYTRFPQSTVDKLAAITIFFSHASVGTNVLEGMQQLNLRDRIRFPLKAESVSDPDAPPKSRTAGTIYDLARGNPPWKEKISSFASYVNNGWRDPLVLVAMNKLCYTDHTAEWQPYGDSVLQLAARYPGTRFVLWTMPLTIWDDSEEVHRATFNQQLRSWVQSQTNLILFDIADLEAWTPLQQHQTFALGGNTYEKMYPGYSSDGGHLNAEGSVRAATGLYTLLAKIAASN